MYIKSSLMALLAVLAAAAPASMTSVVTTLPDTPPTSTSSTSTFSTSTSSTSTSPASTVLTNIVATEVPTIWFIPANTPLTSASPTSTSSTSTSPTSTASTNTDSDENDEESSEDDTQTPDYSDEYYWDEIEDRQFIIMSYQPDYVKNTSSVIHKSVVHASGNDALAVNESLETSCVPGADCSLVHNETVFSLNSRTGRLRLDSLARTQDVFFEEDGEMEYPRVDHEYYDEKYGVTRLQGGWTHEPSTTIDGAGILKFDQRGFYCCDMDPVWPKWVIYADMSLIKERPEGRCFQVDLITFPPKSNARPYAYGIS
ncbi:hypothetical protein E6O75_ATG04838 [Venturia nashicola]|uniref:Uncharacterized protein n=1 Tax=Venturia nashicola TaxID=86259 RepID=A0A4Z1P209_9PEZI|nr:hypothetical protein E6O75_ATG04838 [Venturia nashicola]